jgi:hypothetical protein
MFLEPQNQSYLKRMAAPATRVLGKSVLPSDGFGIVGQVIYPQSEEHSAAETGGVYHRRTIKRAWVVV